MLRWSAFFYWTKNNSRYTTSSRSKWRCSICCTLRCYYFYNFFRIYLWLGFEIILEYLFQLLVVWFVLKREFFYLWVINPEFLRKSYSDLFFVHSKSTLLNFVKPNIDVITFLIIFRLCFSGVPPWKSSILQICQSVA